MSEAKVTGADSPKKESGLSEFIYKILNQLSISAWLPSLFWIAGVTLILQLKNQKNMNIAEAVSRLSGMSYGGIVLLLLALVLSTLVTQAFSFEIIRCLEGYWGGSAWSTWPIRIMTDRQWRRFARIEARRARLIGKVSSNQAGEPDGYDTASAGLRNIIDELASKSEAYPDPSRFLPTLLGNTIRCFEDKLVSVKPDNLEEFVIEASDRLPPSLLDDHDRQRAHLDMYATLTVASIILAITSLLTLPSWTGKASGCAGLFIFAFISYRSAIASARAYGAILIVIDRKNGASKYADPALANAASHMEHFRLNC